MFGFIIQDLTLNYRQDICEWTIQTQTLYFSWMYSEFCTDSVSRPYIQPIDKRQKNYSNHNIINKWV